MRAAVHPRLCVETAWQPVSGPEVVRVGQQARPPRPSQTARRPRPDAAPPRLPLAASEQDQFGLVKLSLAQERGQGEGERKVAAVDVVVAALATRRLELLLVTRPPKPMAPNTPLEVLAESLYAALAQLERRAVPGVARRRQEARLCLLRPARRYRDDVLVLQEDAVRVKRQRLRPARQPHIALGPVAVMHTV